jgi:cytochrome c biogenesis protein CcdA
MDYLHSIINEYNIPALSAFLLGIMTAISPCPLATNVTATAYIARDISSKRKVLLSGILYSLGRAFSYTMIAVILYSGASKFHVARLFQQNGEKILGPVLILLGLIMLNVIRLDFLGKFNMTDRLSERFGNSGIKGSFFLGVIFALAFCPYSGALYFGMLIPMTLVSPSALTLPLLFALGTGLPVIVFTYLLAYGVAGINKAFQSITRIEKAMRKVAGVVFILAGLYYVLIFMKVI